MPSDIPFDILFESAISPDSHLANTCAVNWLRARELLRNDAEADYFADFKVGDFTGRLYPYGQGEDLALATCLIGLFTIADDQIDSMQGRRTELGRQLCQDLLTTINDRLAPASTAYGRAWRELWPRLAEGMSPEWQTRMCAHWSEFAEGLIETNHAAGFLTIEQYLQHRETMNVVNPVLVLGERVGHFEVPTSTLGSPLMRALEEATKIMILPSDVFSLEREESKGETYNLVRIIEHHKGASRQEAIIQIQDMVHQACERFMQLETQIPALCDSLNLDKAQRTSVARRVQGMRYYARGQYDWGREGSPRYTPEGGARARASGYEDTPTPDFPKRDQTTLSPSPTGE